MRAPKTMMVVSLLTLAALLLPTAVLACGKPPNAPLDACEIASPAGAAVHGIVSVTYNISTHVAEAISLVLTSSQGQASTFSAIDVPTDAANRIQIVCAIIDELGPQILTELGYVDADGNPTREIKVTRQSVFGLPCPTDPNILDPTCLTPDPNDVSVPGGFPLGVAVTSFVDPVFTATGKIALYFVKP